MSAPANPDPERTRVPELVIFDCDGVLVDSEGISGEVLARALTAAGLPTSPADALHEYKGLLMADLIERAQTQLGAALPAGFVDAFERDRMVEFRRRLQPVSGAGEAVRTLHAADVKACVASQGKLEKTDQTLRLTGLRDLFADNELFSAYMVARGKPHPDLFLYAAVAMRTSPDRCAVVEDTAIGVDAARSAGMRAFGYVADGDDEPLRLAGAEVLRSLAELPERIGLPRVIRDQVPHGRRAGDA
jgi:HAD superfamily hydrolase (TIGR01509 family)